MWVNEKLRVPKIIDRHLPGFGGDIFFSRHHESHAASAFFCSPFEDAALLVVDGVGEWACTSIGEGSGHSIRLLREGRFPHSLGLFYSAVWRRTASRSTSTRSWTPCWTSRRTARWR